MPSPTDAHHQPSAELLRRAFGALFEVAAARLAANESKPPAEPATKGDEKRWQQ